MAHDKIRCRLNRIGLVLTVGLFLFLQFTRYGDTAGHHVLLQNDYSLRAHWDFFVNSENVFVLLACAAVAYLPLLCYGIYRLIRKR
ncbi:hypothetical protein [Conchiformibius kuhniae]|uniref:Uncharacterized protein n=1 Tax=Conchiformibius kuhniae TaxID=211502 RepID=A0A8T9MWI1_9NEIS|nr:hypothetical protein [Conchiformibius kuhniae]UOP04253.1 hypothetical protein LVJ77_07560 [Conchiformibius kuhniae]